ncbi:class I SAM-dependent methyltransferase [Niallia sp. BSM11]|uniref:class I SAM-dependent methyltransferase n=1 Tax=Niallia sp. BSM11 TaxID=3391576 RepID=UPI003984EC81
MFFDIFQKKYESNTTVVKDFYSDKDIVSYYNQEPDYSDELLFYLNNLDKEKKTLEIGAGNGRILIPLLEKGINIYGIEPSQEMLSKIISNDIRKRILNITLQDFIKNEKPIYDQIIIPATSISLFSPSDIRNFLTHYVQNMPLTTLKLVFDILDSESLKTKNGKIYKFKDNDKKIYSANYIQENKLFNNIYIKNGINEKLGVSVKYIYDDNIVKDILDGFNFKIIKTRDQDIIRLVITLQK